MDMKYYKLTGRALEFAKAYHSNSKEIVDKQIEMVKAINPEFTTFFPRKGNGHDNKSPVYAFCIEGPVPNGFRVLDWKHTKHLKLDGKKRAVVPHMGSKIGKEAKKQMNQIPFNEWTDENLLEGLGFNILEFDDKTMTLFKAQITRLPQPEETFLVQAAGITDNPEKPITAGIVEIPYSEYVAAFEKHNAEAKLKLEAQTNNELVRKEKQSVSEGNKYNKPTKPILETKQKPRGLHVSYEMTSGNEGANYLPVDYLHEDYALVIKSLKGSMFVFMCNLILNKSKVVDSQDFLWLEVGFGDQVLYSSRPKEDK